MTFLYRVSVIIIVYYDDIVIIITIVNYLTMIGKENGGIISMSEINNTAALEARKQMALAFRKKGIFIALLSGFLYGGYTAFLTQGMASGVWAGWYGAKSGLTAFAVVYILSAVGAAVLCRTYRQTWGFRESITDKTGKDFDSCSHYRRAFGINLLCNRTSNGRFHNSSHSCT